MRREPINPVATYLRSLPTVRHTREQEAKLARAAKRGPKAGRKAALEQLTLSVLPMAVHVAAKFQGRGLPLEDLIGVANVATVKAVRTFDAEFGLRLTTYVHLAVYRAVRRATAVQPKAINAPQWMESEWERDKKGKSHVDAAVAVRRMGSLDSRKPIHGEDDEPDGNYGMDNAVGRESEPCDLDAEERQVRRRRVLGALRALPAREQRAIRGLLQGRTLRQVGKSMGISHERVRQLCASGRTKLREMLGVDACD